MIVAETKPVQEFKFSLFVSMFLVFNVAEHSLDTPPVWCSILQATAING